MRITKIFDTDNMDELGQRLEKCLKIDKKVMKQDLLYSNYYKKFCALLSEEMEVQKAALKAHDIKETKMIHCGNRKFLINMKNIKDFLKEGSFVEITFLSSNKKKVAKVEVAKKNCMEILFVKKERQEKPKKECDVSVHYIFNEHNFILARDAMKKVELGMGSNFLFPSRTEPKDENDVTEINWINDKLNEIQKEAILNVVKGASGKLPYIIFGPPGTGKTSVLVELIKQLILLKPMAKILVVAPTNNAVDNLTENFLEEDVPYIRLASETAFKKYKKSYYSTVFPETYNYNIFFSTCYKAVSFPLQFSYVIMDEAGQATEPETMVPVSKLASGGQLVLAGDSKQLGPYVESQESKKYGLGVSFLERLLDTELYRRKNSCKNVVTHLRYNYRSVKNIVNVSSKLYYEGKLIPTIKISTNKLFKNILECMPSEFKEGGIYMQHVNGMCVNKETSYENIKEAKALVDFMLVLMKNGVKTEDIGIIIPYVSQIALVTRLCKEVKPPIKMPEIGTVEKYQGREKLIILVNTVRSRTNLGFVKEPQRLNVMITRAKFLTIIFGNQNTLSQSKDFMKIINYWENNAEEKKK